MRSPPCTTARTLARSGPNGAWNRRLVYTFGGGCNVGYHQGATTGGVHNDLFLARGFAVASSSLNVLDNNCSPVISAEAAMMVKEHFIEEYGPVAHTIGWGASGGAIQQYQIADNYPGILDGIVPQLSFPDPLTTTGPTVGDCRLLNRYFTANPTLFTPAERTAASGYGTFGSCVSWDVSFASRGNPTEACPPAIPPEFLYNPATNPGGIKCTSTEQWANQLGRDPDTGFARSVTDNVGVQYGLAALNAGQITAQPVPRPQREGRRLRHQRQLVPARNAADLLGLFRVYRSGLVTSGGRAWPDRRHRPAGLPRRRLQRHPHHRMVLRYEGPDGKRRHRRQPGHHRERAEHGRASQRVRLAAMDRVADRDRRGSLRPVASDKVAANGRPTCLTAASWRTAHWSTSRCPTRGPANARPRTRWRPTLGWSPANRWR